MNIKQCVIAGEHVWQGPSTLSWLGIRVEPKKHLVQSDQRYIVGPNKVLKRMGFQQGWVSAIRSQATARPRFPCLISHHLRRTSLAPQLDVSKVGRIVPKSFFLRVVMPGATSSFLLLVAMPFVTSSDQKHTTLVLNYSNK